MAVDAYEYYNAAIVATRVSDEREYYNATITPSRIGAESNEREYYNVNQLEDTLCNVNWFNTWEAETLWRPGTMFNGTEFRRYKMWDGTRWVESCGDEPADPLSVYPNAVVAYAADDNTPVPGPFVDLPAIPAGTTSAVALVSAGVYTDIAIPSGWTLLEKTDVGGTGTGSIHAVAVKIDNVIGNEGLRFDFSNPTGGDYDGRAYAVAYFSGGMTGTWNHIKGVEYAGTSYGTFADVPNAGEVPRIWWQAGIITAVYTSFTSDVPDITGDSNGFMVPFVHPAVGTSTGSNFYARYLTGHPATSSNYVDTDSIGAYGWPCSTTFGFYWTPPV